MIVSDLAKSPVIQIVVRPVCDWWASCF